MTKKGSVYCTSMFFLQSVLIGLPSGISEEKAPFHNVLHCDNVYNSDTLQRKIPVCAESIYEGLIGGKKIAFHTVCYKREVKWNETVATWTPTADTAFNIFTHGSSIT